MRAVVVVCLDDPVVSHAVSTSVGAVLGAAVFGKVGESIVYLSHIRTVDGPAIVGSGTAAILLVIVAMFVVVCVFVIFCTHRVASECTGCEHNSARTKCA